VMLTLDKVQPSAEVVCRFIGATSGSADVRALLDNVSRKIDRTYDVAVEGPGTSYEDLIRDFPTRLAAATPDKPLVVMLDALDQLSEANNARSLAWLPATMPENCRVLVSTTPGECKTALERKLAEERLLQLTEMSKEEGEELLGLWLDDAQRTLQTKQRTAVIDRFLGCAIPLYLKLAFEEARRWHSYDHLDDPAGTLAPDVTGLITGLYGRLELPQNHGTLLVERSLGYLAAARYGLSEEELLGALCQDDEFFAEFATQAHHDLPGIVAGVALEVEDLPAPGSRDLPIAVWSRLYYDLEPYLSERDEEDAHVLTFYHRQLREVAASLYLAEGDWKIDEQTPLTAVGMSRHQTLAAYLGRRADPEPPDDEGFHSWSGEYRRAFAELPYHLTMAQQWDRVFAALTDFTFLERKSVKIAVDEHDEKEGASKTVYNGPYQLQDDYRLALDAFPTE
ncbi:MAG TPA: NACHT domain-containing protein, partial [Thermoleophilia bacterium]